MIATPPVDDLPTVPGSVDLLYHSYNFDPAFVLQGDIDILALDMFSTLIGLEPPSSIYGAFLSQERSLYNKVYPSDTFTQIHFIDSHYVVSHQERETVYIYDSLPNQQRISRLLPQLVILYDLLKKMIHFQKLDIL